MYKYQMFLYVLVHYNCDLFEPVNMYGISTEEK